MDASDATFLGDLAYEAGVEKPQIAAAVSAAAGAGVVLFTYVEPKLAVTVLVAGGFLEINLEG